MVGRVDIDRVRTAGREVKLGVFPMGIDSAEFSNLAADANVLARVEALRHDAGGRRIVLGIDRLDYTKGIPRRLEALECLLERDAALRDGIRYIQIAVPSREEVDSYRQFRREVEERVGHINGAYGTARSLPVHYVHGSVSPRELVALYCAADVMLVTPLRDGMNLVAKEFVASRGDEDGVLVLSEFAGAAAELNGAVIVNPYDIEGVADSIQRALSMPVEERRSRMRVLRRRVFDHDVHAWAGAFLGAPGWAAFIRGSRGRRAAGSPPRYRSQRRATGREIAATAGLRRDLGAPGALSGAGRARRRTAVAAGAACRIAPDSARHRERQTARDPGAMVR